MPRTAWKRAADDVNEFDEVVLVYRNLGGTKIQRIIFKGRQHYAGVREVAGKVAKQLKAGARVLFMGDSEDEPDEFRAIPATEQDCP